MIHKHIEGVRVKAKFSKEKPEPRYRYSLEINSKTSDGRETVCVIMLNPSYADEKRADKSVQFLENVVFQRGKAEGLFPEFKGVHRLIIVNLFAFRQTNDFEGNKNQIGQENDRTIKKALKKADIIVIAWGKSSRFRDRQHIVRGWVDQIEGKLKYESPHPSRAGYIGFIGPLK